jgi:hypothetical protein
MMSRGASIWPALSQRRDPRKNAETFCSKMQ